MSQQTQAGTMKMGGAPLKMKQQKACAPAAILLPPWGMGANSLASTRGRQINTIPLRRLGIMLTNFREKERQLQDHESQE